MIQSTPVNRYLIGYSSALKDPFHLVKKRKSSVLWKKLFSNLFYIIAQGPKRAHRLLRATQPQIPGPVALGQEKEDRKEDQHLFGAQYRMTFPRKMSLLLPLLHQQFQNQSFVMSNSLQMEHLPLHELFRPFRQP